jgi:hypothetical protein
MASAKSTKKQRTKSKAPEKGRFVPLATAAAQYHDLIAQKLKEMGRNPSSIGSVASDPIKSSTFQNMKHGQASAPTIAKVEAWLGKKPSEVYLKIQ